MWNTFGRKNLHNIGLEGFLNRHFCYCVFNPGHTSVMEIYIAAAVIRSFFVKTARYYLHKYANVFWLYFTGNLCVSLVCEILIVFAFIHYTFILVSRTCWRRLYLWRLFAVSLSLCVLGLLSSVFRSHSTCVKLYYLVSPSVHAYLAVCVYFWS